MPFGVPRGPWGGLSAQGVQRREAGDYKSAGGHGPHTPQTGFPQTQVAPAGLPPCERRTEERHDPYHKTARDGKGNALAWVSRAAGFGNDANQKPYQREKAHSQNIQASRDGRRAGLRGRPMAGQTSWLSAVLLDEPEDVDGCEFMAKTFLSEPLQSPTAEARRYT